MKYAIRMLLLSLLSGAVEDSLCEPCSEELFVKLVGADELPELVELCEFEFSVAEELPRVLPQAVSENAKATVNIAINLFIRAPLICEVP